MKIELFGKPDCHLCESLKQKLTDNLKVPFTAYDITVWLALHEGWRTDGTVELKAKHDLIDGRIPMVLINNEPFDYASALAEIKKRLNAGDAAVVEAPRPAPTPGLVPGYPATEEDFLVAIQLLFREIEWVEIIGPTRRTHTFPSTEFGKPRHTSEERGEPIRVEINHRYFGPLALYRKVVTGKSFRDVLEQLTATKNDLGVLR